MFLIASQVARVFLVSGKTVFAIAKLAGALMSLCIFKNKIFKIL